MSTKSFKGVFEFNSPINRESSFGITNLSPQAKSILTITISDAGIGYIEWEVPSLDEYEEIGLWFDGNKLTDYDGVMSFPEQAIEFLEQQGYDMSEAKSDILILHK